VEPVTNAGRATDPLTVTRSSGDAIPSDDVFTLDYSTQIEILQSPGMLDSIVQEVQTQYPNFTFEQLRQGLSVARLVPEGADETRIIQVAYQHPDAALVQTVLKVTADRYLRYSLEERKTRFGEGIKFIDDQLPEAQQRVEGIQDQIQRLQQQYDLIDPDAQGGQLSEGINEIATAQLQTERDLQEQRILYNNLSRQLALTPQEAIAASALSEDPGWVNCQRSGAFQRFESGDCVSARTARQCGELAEPAGSEGDWAKLTGWLYQTASVGLPKLGSH
jgi:polysaccharide biosynthesis transport protein